MSWWGKVIGGAFGFMLGGPLGGLLGATLGHGFDKGLNGIDLLSSDQTWQGGSQERVQAAFFTATFSVMGHLAKADGRVTEDEIELARQTMNSMQLDEAQRRTAIELFNSGKQDDFPLVEVLEQLKRECHRRVNLIQMFLEIQIATALADGDLHPAEQQVLMLVADHLGVSRGQFERLLAMVVAQQRFSRRGGGREAPVAKESISEAYQLLGVTSDSTDAEVKKAYRRLMSQHHPDKLVSKGLPEEMMKIATEKTREIKAAYEVIKASRKKI
ncbi:co-chaperone DjlA [Alkalimarinus sediminis]|uniref:Co-chaperone protein DjlA n=1 Tax=Alkalimarinus sediminis TaxID=1632866 RepID=A0A9E8HQ93_9ALTE|nr:co-chaperone DjlA [Alkalimarinus sediminis]UZW74561.1 co-chaperone DjlA [Alkalimarinus sediminis]